MFALFDPPKRNNLMTPVFVDNCFETMQWFNSLTPLESETETAGFLKSFGEVSVDVCPFRKEHFRYKML